MLGLKKGILFAGTSTRAPVPKPRGENNVYSANTPDAFITELSPTGAIVLSTFFGGSANESPVGIGLDAAGNIYIAVALRRSIRTGTGNIYPPGGNVPFPVTANAFQGSVMSGNNANFFVGFVSKFSATTHQMVYSTVIGPAVPQTIATSMSVSRFGTAHVGSVWSTGFLGGMIRRKWARAILQVCRLSEPDWRKMSTLAHAKASVHTWEEGTRAFDRALRKLAENMHFWRSANTRCLSWRQPQWLMLASLNRPTLCRYARHVTPATCEPSSGCRPA